MGAGGEGVKQGGHGRFHNSGGHGRRTSTQQSSNQLPGACHRSRVGHTGNVAAGRGRLTTGRLPPAVPRLLLLRGGVRRRAPVAAPAEQRQQEGREGVQVAADHCKRLAHKGLRQGGRRQGGVAGGQAGGDVVGSGRCAPAPAGPAAAPSGSDRGAHAAWGPPRPSRERALRLSSHTGSSVSARSLPVGCTNCE